MEINKPKNVYEALWLFQSIVPKILVDEDVEVATKNGGKYSFRYAGLPNIKEIIKPFMKDAQLSAFQTQCVDAGIRYMRTYIYHISGDALASNVEMPELKPTIGADKTERQPTAQEYGSMLSYFRRYGLALALGLVTEDDDDGNSASGNTIEKREKVISRDELYKFSDDDMMEMSLNPDSIWIERQGAKNGKKWLIVGWKDKKGFLSPDQYNYIKKDGSI